ncbi:hypothetical protein ACFQ7O_17145 [Streptomyces sp. NPDC056485]|uniref:hypothetical protein n=1 Tax=Streptomyces sp. NPDC056485 TaxID=3345834 RepID=UPI0036C86DC2
MTGHLLPGLAANPALPAELLDRLIEHAARDPETAEALSERTDLGPARACALAAHDEDAAARLARAGLLRAGDVDPAARPSVALALLDRGAGPADWARLLAAHPDPGIRESLASRPGLPPDVPETLAGDPDVGVAAELALWTTRASVAARLAAHPHAEVRRGAAADEATPPAALAALITGEGSLRRAPAWSATARRSPSRTIRTVPGPTASSAAARPARAGTSRPCTTSCSRPHGTRPRRWRPPPPSSATRRC